MATTLKRSVLLAARTPVSGRLRKALAEQGIVVVAECVTAAEAIETAARELPDVCVLDRQLPGGVLTATAAITAPRQRRR
jgi:CheY-like chemotaxis protein